MTRSEVESVTIWFIIIVPAGLFVTNCNLEAWMERGGHEALSDYGIGCHLSIVCQLC